MSSSVQSNDSNTTASNLAFNDEVAGGNFNAAGSSAANAADSVAFRSSGNDNVVNANRSSTIGTTSGNGNYVLGTGATFLQDLNADLARDVVTGANANVGVLLNAFADNQKASNTFQAGLVDGFKGIAEATGSTLRGALSATLNAPALEKPADTSATLAANSTQRLFLIGGALLIGGGLLYLASRKR